MGRKPIAKFQSRNMNIYLRFLMSGHFTQMAVYASKEIHLITLKFPKGNTGNLKNAKLF